MPEPATYQDYLAGVARGALVYQHCGGCNRAVFYLRPCCPHCGSEDLTLRDSQGTGTVYSATLIHDREQNYNLVLVDLDEGFRMMSSVPETGLPGIGARVSAYVEHAEGIEPRVMFKLQPGETA